MTFKIKDTQAQAEYTGEWSSPFVVIITLLSAAGLYKDEISVRKTNML